MSTTVKETGCASASAVEEQSTTESVAFSAQLTQLSLWTKTFKAHKAQMICIKV